MRERAAVTAKGLHVWGAPLAIAVFWSPGRSDMLVVASGTVCLCVCAWCVGKGRGAEAMATATVTSSPTACSVCHVWRVRMHVIG